MEKGALVLTPLWAPLVPHRFIVKVTFQRRAANRLGLRLNRAGPATLWALSRAGDEVPTRARPAAAMCVFQPRARKPPSSSYS
jgi:hypothetical protein